MTKTKGILQTELYYAEHLDAVRDKKDIEAFTINLPEGQGLSTYLKDYALKEEARVMRTYLVRDIDTDELVGYFSLKAGLASINESVTEVADEETGRICFRREFDTVPGVELANFAVNSKYVEKYPYHKSGVKIIFIILRKPLETVCFITFNQAFVWQSIDVNHRYSNALFHILDNRDDKVIKNTPS